jgi:hypothetical protein
MYLTHFAFVLALERVHITWEGSAGLRFGIILAGSVISTIALQQVPGGRFLLGMDSENGEPVVQNERELPARARIPAIPAISG